MSDQDQTPEPDQGFIPEEYQNDVEVLNFCIEAGWHIERDDHGLVRLSGDFTNTPLEGLQIALDRMAGFIIRLGFTESDLTRLADSIEWVLKTCAFFELLDIESEEFESISEALDEAGCIQDSDLLDADVEEDSSEDWWKTGQDPPFYDT